MESPRTSPASCSYKTPTQALFSSSLGGGTGQAWSGRGCSCKLQAAPRTDSCIPGTTRGQPEPGASLCARRDAGMQGWRGGSDLSGCSVPKLASGQAAVKASLRNSLIQAAAFKGKVLQDQEKECSEVKTKSEPFGVSEGLSAAALQHKFRYLSMLFGQNLITNTQHLFQQIELILP